MRRALQVIRGRGQQEIISPMCLLVKKRPACPECGRAGLRSRARLPTGRKRNTIHKNGVIAIDTSNHNGNDLPGTGEGTAEESGTALPDNHLPVPTSPGMEREHNSLSVTTGRKRRVTPRPVRKNSVRRNTLSDLHGTDPEVPYVKTERAVRDLVCSLLERQDRMNEAIFCRLIDTECRVDDLETSLQTHRKKAGEEGGKK